MDNEDRLKRFILENHIDAEHLSLSVSCHSVQDAAKAVDADPSAFVKNICMTAQDNQCIIAIVPGQANASTSRVAKTLNINRPRLATPEEISSLTSYPCGGTPSFGFQAIFLIDPKVMEMDILYTGGGSETSLVKTTPQELIKANRGTVVRIRR